MKIFKKLVCYLLTLHPFYYLIKIFCGVAKLNELKKYKNYVDIRCSIRGIVSK